MAIVIKRKKPASERLTKSDNVKKGHFIRLFGKTVKPLDVTYFLSQLSLMLEIGTPLARGLKAAADQTKNPEFAGIIRSILLDIEEGRQLSEGMSRYPDIFDGIIVSMVKAGETGGFLKEILDRIVLMQEKHQALVTQIRSVLTYPIVLSIMSFAVIIFVLVGILPKFTILFAGKEAILPFSTRFLMHLSLSLRLYWWVYIIVITGIIFGLKFWKTSKAGKTIIDRFLLSAPLAGRISNKIYTSQLLRILGSLMESQVPLLEALKVTRDTFTNRYFRDFLDKIIEHVNQGGKLSRSFADNPYVLESVKQMVVTGEEVGNLPKIMLRLADFYDNEVEKDLKIVSSMIEPVALIILGIVVGLIVSSVILPIFKIAHTIH